MNSRDSEDLTLENSLKNRLQKIEKELEKVRGASPITHGWQTQKLAKAQRKWDALATEKRAIIMQLDVLENFRDMFYGDTLSQ